MANNRMYLVNKRTGDRVYLAKYYPSTGWYSVAKDLAGRLDDAFEEADFGHLTDEQQAINAVHAGFSAPHKAAGGMYAAEWVVEYETKEGE